MANKSNEVKRIVFQPTEANRDKLILVAEKNEVSVSVILNLLLDNLDENTRVEIRLVDSESPSKNK